jgi:hypothetical protein
MNAVVVFFILLGAFPFLFPDVCRVWLERVQQWLVAYEEKRKQTWRVERALEEETREWEQWVQHAKWTLHRAKSAEERVLLLAQIEAAGERFLGSLNHWEDGKPADPAMKKVEKKTKAVLDLLSDNAQNRRRDCVDWLKGPAKVARPVAGAKGACSRSGAGILDHPGTGHRKQDDVRGEEA